jgi:membrane protein CcdC involved in cytochrome C biogenesis
MVNKTHLKVLIKKDLITLWRSKGFLIAFLILPIVLICLFIWIKSLVDNGEKSGSLIYDYFRYTSTIQPDSRSK